MEENAKIILAVVSSYGTMAEPGDHYLIIIKAHNKEELAVKFKTFILSEAERALKDPEIMADLEEIDPQSVIDDIDLTDLLAEPEQSDIISVPGLATDYHLEYDVIDHLSPLAGAGELVVMTEYDNECMGQSEFARMMQIFDPKAEKEEAHSVGLNDPVIGTESEIAEMLLCWDRHFLKVI